MAVVAQPAYERIAREVLEDVRAGRLAPGEPAPTERELIDRSGASRGTVNRAVALLRSWGVIETQVGRPPRVVPDPDGRVFASGPDEHTDRIRQGRPIYDDAETSVIYEASVLSVDTPGIVSAAVLRAVDLPEPNMGDGPRIVKRARIMRRDGEAIGACTTWLPHAQIVGQGPAGAELVKRLTSMTERFPGGTGKAVADLYGRELTASTTRAGVRPLPLQVARELGVDAGTQVLWLLVTRWADEFIVEADEWFRLGDTVLR